MRRPAVAVVAALLAVGALSGCGQQLRDLKDVPVTDPDRLRLVANVDAHPNVVAICIEGAGFATTTRDYTALIRVEEWDASTGGWCKQGGAQ